MPTAVICRPQGLGCPRPPPQAASRGSAQLSGPTGTEVVAGREGDSGLVHSPGTTGTKTVILLQDGEGTSDPIPQAPGKATASERPIPRGFSQGDILKGAMDYLVRGSSSRVGAQISLEPLGRWGHSCPSAGLGPPTPNTLYPRDAPADFTTLQASSDISHPKVGGEGKKLFSVRTIAVSAKFNIK